jgi:amino acid transporter
MSGMRQTAPAIGLGGAIASIVGVVVGIAIFILPGHLASIAGPGVILSYGLAALVAGFSCAVAAQIGSVFPVSGASYVAVSRVLSPMSGFLVVWMMLLAIVLGIALLALGFADYLAFFFPHINRLMTALILIITLGGINLFGVRSTVALQVVLVVLIVAALAVYGVVGVLRADPRLFTPFFPRGFRPVLLSTIPAFFSFAAFAVVIEVAGDIKRPNRTIPVAFVVSFLLVTLLYLSVTVATVGNVPWQQLGSTSAPVGDVARKILWPRVANAIVLIALAGAASPINALVLSYSRDIMVLSKVKAFPAVLGKVSRSRNVPYGAVMAIVVAAMLIAPFSGRLTEIATLSTLSILVLQLALALVVLLLPSRSPKQFEQAKLRFGRVSRLLFGGGLALMSILLLLVAAWQKPLLFALALGLVLVGALYYTARKHYLQARGFDFDRSMLQSNWSAEHV